MKRHIMIEIILVILFSVVSFWNVKKQNEMISLKEDIVELKKENKENEIKKQQLLSENEHLSYQVTKASNRLKRVQQEYINSGTDIDLNTEFIDVVTKLFEVNLNFNPENYKDRKKEVSSYLSDELKKEYFGQKRNTYQDANGTTSKLETLDVYPKEIQNDHLEGLVVVGFKSKQSDQEWVGQENIFKIIYNIKTKKIEEVLTLGNNSLHDRTDNESF